MKVFLDANIVIDSLSNRIPFAEPANQILSLADTGKIKVAVSVLTFTTAEYVLSKVFPKEIVLIQLRMLKPMVEVVALTDIMIDEAMEIEFSDFENGIQYLSAGACKADRIITRDLRGFRKSSIPVMTSSDFIRTW